MWGFHFIRALVLSVLLTGWASSQTPVLVMDINTSPSTSQHSWPSNFVSVGLDVYFTATTPAAGREIYRSAGTASTTSLVKDLLPGAASGWPRNLTPFGNALLFEALTPTSTMQWALWRTDGTLSGTRVVVPPSTYAGPPIVLGGTVLFQGLSAAHGAELWRTDGTTAGTTLVKDINPGTGASSPRPLGVFNGFAYFAGDDGLRGEELWRSDGTAAGTQLVADLAPGSPGSGPASFHDTGSFFLLGTRGSVPALWRSDGTAAGTTLLYSFPPTFPPNQGPGGFARLGGRVYFSATDSAGTELWETDGTRAGTRLLKDLQPGSKDGRPSSLTRLGNILLFTADDGATGLELWRTDGTAAGTVRVKDIHPGVAGSSPSHLQVFNNALYFAADDGIHGLELWRSDGTAQGTTLLKDFAPDRGGSGIGTIVATANRLWVDADDGTGSEPWVSDGTAAGTVLLKDLSPPPPGTANADPRDFVSLLGTTLFAATTRAHGTELWKTDGTANGTAMIKDIVPGPHSSGPWDLTVLGGHVFFSARHSSSAATVGLWRTDGTTQGTVLVKTFTELGGFAAGGDTLFFWASDGQAGRELWKSDGTTTGTVMVKDIVPGSGTSSPAWLMTVGRTAFFAATDAGNDRELWTSDGTAAGTVRLKDINPQGSSQPGWPAGYRGAVYFSADDGVNGTELWKSDGTPSGTVLVKDIDPVVGSSPSNLTAAAGRLFFTASGAQPFQRLWVSDGTAAGTQAIPMNLTPTVPRNFTPFGRHRVLFAADDGVNGTEPWVSDGTAVGTFMLQNTDPATWSYSGFDIVASGSRFAWFAARSPADLWSTDGTVAGTRPVSSHRHNSSALNPAWLSMGSGRIFFSGHDGPEGRELWMIDPGASSIQVGQGFGAGLRTPELRFTDPVIGSTAVLSGDQSAAGAVAFVALSPGLARPIRLGGGRLLYLNPASFVLLRSFVVQQPTWTANVPIPADARLVGQPVSLQVLFAPTNAPGGIDLTNAVHAWLGR